MSWQRSTEAPDKIIIETSLGSKLNEALALPPDPNQTVFDNGISTPQGNKNNVPRDVSWASWVQYSANGQRTCGPTYELRHFQAKFNLDSLSADISSMKLKSPYYPQEVFPINDNAYIYVNGNFVKRLGINYGAVNHGLDGTAPYANETDGWVANGNLGKEAAAFLKVGQNTMDIVAGETCWWGGMGKVELVLTTDGPTPFLDLPWNYAGDGLSFTDAALAINSYFDHEYPLLSTGLSEPSNATGTFGFDGQKPQGRFYSSHDGYDYGGDASVHINNPVLAAASGCALYSYNGAGGNIIKIDHKNGYQTRYLHLQPDGLITQSSTNCVQVTQGQQIGKVGATGNVIPAGEDGAHIHFMVIKDKDNDGNFDNNIPDGLTDPFGWQSAEPDPWPSYTFSYTGQDRTGNSSFYLWQKAIANLSDQLTTNGKFFEVERFKFDFPQGATDQNLNIEIKSQPNTKPSNFLHSIGTTIKVTAKDAFGNAVKKFKGLFTVTVDFDGADLSKYDTNSMAIYSSEDGISWIKEETDLNFTEKTASAKLDHLSYFALFAERTDTVAPATSAILNGQQGQPNVFRSDVQVSLNAQDNANGLGVEYTLFKLDDGDWQQYQNPQVVAKEGTHTIEFYSVDRDENIEEGKKVIFSIDKNHPEAKITTHSSTFRPKFSALDENELTTINDQQQKPKRYVTITDSAGNSITLNGTYKEQGRNSVFSFESIQYNNSSKTKVTKNNLTIDYTVDANKNMNGLTQIWNYERKVKLKIFYDRKRNQSTIYTDQNGKLKEKEKRTGIVLLFLKTNNGNLEFGY